VVSAHRGWRARPLRAHNSFRITRTSGHAPFELRVWWAAADERSG
jgi:hypothetical protein